MEIEYAKVSAVGDRQDNQDRAAIVVADDAAIMLVFDGMGGHSDGARAAETGLKLVQAMFTSMQLPVFDPQGFLYMALSRAHDAVVSIGTELPVDFRPRATCAICLIQESGTYWAHIGDSRIYHLRDGRVLSRSRDHSHVEVLIQEGAISEEEALDHPYRSAITRVLGTEEEVDVDTLTVPLHVGDLYLLCSDGLTSMVRDEEILALVEAHSGDVDTTAAELVKAANAAGGEDNITLVLFEITDGEPAAAAAPGIAPSGPAQTPHPVARPTVDAPVTRSGPSAGSRWPALLLIATVVLIAGLLVLLGITR